MKNDLKIGQLVRIAESPRIEVFAGYATNQYGKWAFTRPLNDSSGEVEYVHVPEDLHAVSDEISDL